MQQRQRLKHLDRFQEQEDVVMFASDVAARGYFDVKLIHRSEIAVSLTSIFSITE